MKSDGSLASRNKIAVLGDTRKQKPTPHISQNCDANTAQHITTSDNQPREEHFATGFNKRSAANVNQLRTTDARFCQYSSAVHVR